MKESSKKKPPEKEPNMGLESPLDKIRKFRLPTMVNSIVVVSISVTELLRALIPLLMLKAIIDFLERLLGLV